MTSALAALHSLKDYPQNEKKDRSIEPFAGISLSEKHSDHM